MQISDSWTIAELNMKVFLKYLIINEKGKWIMICGKYAAIIVPLYPAKAFRTSNPKRRREEYYYEIFPIKVEFLLQANRMIKWTKFISLTSFCGPRGSLGARIEERLYACSLYCWVKCMAVSVFIFTVCRIFLFCLVLVIGYMFLCFFLCLFFFL